MLNSWLKLEAHYKLETRLTPIGARPLISLNCPNLPSHQDSIASCAPLYDLAEGVCLIAGKFLVSSMSCTVFGRTLCARKSLTKVETLSPSLSHTHNAQPSS